VRDETSPNERIHGRKNGNNKSKISPLRPFSDYPSLEMKFRHKFEKINWVMPALAIPQIALELSSHHDSTIFKAFVVSSWVSVILLYVYAWLFPRLELDAFRLRRRGLFRTKEVSLAEITRVKNLGFSTDRVQIEFRPPDSFVETRSIVVNPADRTDFVAALRQVAPRATFE
jgi:hypothetical protein